MSLLWNYHVFPGEGPHGIFVVFKGRILGLGLASDTEAKAGMCVGAACVARQSRSVKKQENAMKS